MGSSSPLNIDDIISKAKSDNEKSAAAKAAAASKPSDYSISDKQAKDYGLANPSKEANDASKASGHGPLRSGHEYSNAPYSLAKSK